MACSGCPKCEPKLTQTQEPPVNKFKAVLDKATTFTKVVLHWNPPYHPVLWFSHPEEGTHAAPITLEADENNTPTRILDLNELAKLCHTTSVEHGFYDPPPSLEERLILIVSEVTEILEEHRDGRAPTDVRYKASPNVQGLKGNEFHGQKPEGIPSEFADVIIRVLDACSYYGIDIDAAVREKMEYNKTRPYKHGRVR